MVYYRQFIPPRYDPAFLPLICNRYNVHNVGAHINELLSVTFDELVANIAYIKTKCLQ